MSALPEWAHRPRRGHVLSPASVSLGQNYRNSSGELLGPYSTDVYMTICWGRGGQVCIPNTVGTLSHESGDASGRRWYLNLASKDLADRRVGMRRREYLGAPEGAKPWSWTPCVPTGPVLSWAAPAQSHSSTSCPGRCPCLPHLLLLSSPSQTFPCEGLVLLPGADRMSCIPTKMRRGACLGPRVPQVWKGYLQRRRTQQDRRTEMEFIGMVSPRLTSGKGSG